jgi:hypothetical protein
MTTTMTTTDDRLARLGTSRAASPARRSKLVAAGLAPAAVLGITAVLARGGPAEVAAPVPPDSGVGAPVLVDTSAPTTSTVATEIYLSVPPPPAAIPRAVPATGPTTRPLVAAPPATAGVTPAPAPAPVPAPAPAPAPAATTGGSH